MNSLDSESSATKHRSARHNPLLYLPQTTQEADRRLALEAVAEHQRKERLRRASEPSALRRLYDTMVFPAVWRVKTLVEEAIRPEAEAGNNRSALRNRAELWISLNKRWLLGYALALMLFIGVCVWFVRPHPGAMSMEEKERLRDRELVSLLATPAQDVVEESMNSGFLPCGKRLEWIQKQLVKLVTQDRSETVSCATAKHLNTTYNAIGIRYRPADSERDIILVLWNTRIYQAHPEDDAHAVPHGVELYAPSAALESSDFFPHLPPIHVTRPYQGWVEYTHWSVPGSFGKYKPFMSGLAFKCVAHSVDVLSGQHLAMVEEQKSLYYKKLHEPE